MKTILNKHYKMNQHQRTHKPRGAIIETLIELMVEEIHHYQLCMLTMRLNRPVLVDQCLEVLAVVRHYQLCMLIKVAVEVVKPVAALDKEKNEWDFLMAV